MLNTFGLMNGAQRIVNVCATLKPGESVLVVTDTELIDIADAIAAAASERGGDVVTTVMQPVAVDGAEPPYAVAQALKAVDVGILPVSRSITHSRAVREALEHGTRVVSLAAFTRDMMIRGGLYADFAAHRPLCNSLARMFGQANQAFLSTPAGTDITLNLKGRPGNSHPGIVDGPGEFTAVPNIEANVAPNEGYGDGTIVFDGSVPNLRMGVADKPILLRIEKGSVVNVSGGRQAGVLRGLWEEQGNLAAYTVAQLAVGLNPRCVAFTGEFLNDHGAYGTVHIGIGTSHNLGGHTDADIHIDGMMYRPTLVLDGVTVVRDGVVVVGE